MRLFFKSTPKKRIRYFICIYKNINNIKFSNTTLYDKWFYLNWYVNYIKALCVCVCYLDNFYFITTEFFIFFAYLWFEWKRREKGEKGLWYNFKFFVLFKSAETNGKAILIRMGNNNWFSFKIFTAFFFWLKLNKTKIYSLENLVVMDHVVRSI